MKQPLLFALFLMLSSFRLCVYAQQQDSAAIVRGVQLIPMANGVWRHVSHILYEGTPVPSNGLILESENELLMIDTPCTNLQTDSLLSWAKTTLKKPFRGVIATHAHEDRVGGLATLQKHGIDVWTTPLTGEWSVKRGFGAPSKAILPNDTTFRFGKFTVRVFFPGAGHTVDNIVVWIAEPRIMVGGCLIKTGGTQSVGFIGDAVLNEWSNSVRKVGEQFSSASVVVPGHGEPGGTELFSHTIAIIDKHLKQRPTRK